MRARVVPANTELYVPNASSGEFRHDELSCDQFPHYSSSHPTMD